MDASAILDRVRSIPEGLVATYGDISPGSPRHAGAVLSACSDETVPWQRVVRADGSLAKGDRQRRLLEAEGVPFDGARVGLDQARVPREALDFDLAQPGVSPQLRPAGPAGPAGG